MLLDFFLTSPFTQPWFGVDEPGNPADVNGDGVVNVEDLVLVLLAWGPCPPPPAPCPADVNGNGGVNVQDLAAVLLAWES